MISENDTECWATHVDSVSAAGDGWSVKGTDGWSMFVTNSECKVEPKPGESIYYYGRGIGYSVRGIVIGRRVYRYQTAEAHEVEQAEMRARLTREREEAESSFRVSKKPPLAKFKVRDEALWADCVKNNDDPYGFRVIQYAADWASFMERDLIPGTRIADVAEKTSREADTDGITGFMYGAAVSTLAGVWEHGEGLRRWHNKETQVGGEGDRANESGGTLNPALLSVVS